MNLRQKLAVAAVATSFVAAPAAAQFQPAMPQQQPPCFKEFAALRDDAVKKADAIRAAEKKKVPPTEACKLLTALAAAQNKMLKYAKANATWCGIPQQIIGEISTGHKQADSIRARVCKIAANPPRPRGPTMSDALGVSAIPDAGNIKKGHGTFDTLTGTPLGAK
ncbi:MAG TPA: hypothetical protein VFX37_12765 [Pseudolabrys sp.]|nr:hypothetical protein [Pseudolabrys sp.]